MQKLILLCVLLVTLHMNFNAHASKVIYVSELEMQAMKQVKDNPELTYDWSPSGWRKGFTQKCIDDYRKLNPEYKTEQIHKTEFFLDDSAEFAPLEIFDKHTEALDVFIDEGSRITSYSFGFVIYAFNSWSLEYVKGQLEAGKTIKEIESSNGGNVVIVYNPYTKKFYRYAHMNFVAVKEGMTVNAGDLLGSVGHTGMVASESTIDSEGNIVYPKGRHVHFSILEIKDNTFVPMTSFAMRDELRIARQEKRSKRIYAEIENKKLFSFERKFSIKM